MGYEKGRAKGICGEMRMEETRRGNAEEA